MATAREYATQAWAIEKAIAAKMGLQLEMASKDQRITVRSLLLIIAVLMKLLVDKGVLTNAELTGAFAFIRDDTYPDEPVDRPEPTP